MTQTNKKNIEIDDDKKLLELIENDNILEKDIDMAVVEQSGDTLLAYHITGIYKDDDKKIYNSRRVLKKNPPVLTFKDSNENEVRFSLTKEFTKELVYSLTEVDKAYSGYHYNIGKDDREKPVIDMIKDFPSNYKKRPVRYTLTILIIIGVLAAIIF